MIIQVNYIHNMSYAIKFNLSSMSLKLSVINVISHLVAHRETCHITIEECSAVVIGLVLDRFRQ